MIQDFIRGVIGGFVIVYSAYLGHQYALASSGKKRRIIINNCYGGFSLSQKAIDELRKRHHLPVRLNEHGLEVEERYLRDDPIFIDTIEEMGKEAWGKNARLAVVEIPYDVEWRIEDYDGKEYVAERHRVWHAKETVEEEVFELLETEAE